MNSGVPIGDALHGRARTSVKPEHGAVWIGANFWSRVRRTADVEPLQRGRSSARSSPFWPSTGATSRARSASGRTSCPEAERLDEDVLARFTDFLDAHVEAGLGTIPTFIVGHMSGENWDPAWRQGRDLYRDVWLVSQQAWFAARGRAQVRRAPGDRGLARVERDAALRRTGDERGGRRLGPRARRGGAVGRCDTADLARRRRLGRRGDGRGQRLLAAGACAARRLLRPARLSDAGRPGAPGRSPQPSRASWPGASASRSCSRSSASARTSHPTTTRPTTTARCCTPRCSRAHAAGSRGTTATTTTSARRTRIGITSSRCTSGSPTGQGGRSSSCTRWPSSPRSWASCRGRGGSASPATRRSSCRSTSSACCRSPTRSTEATSAPTFCSRTSPRGRRTSRSGSSGSATACPTPRASTSSPARSC